MPAPRKRLVRTCTPVARIGPLTEDSYPSKSSTFIYSIHDIRYLQALLANERNFAQAKDSSCHVFEIDRRAAGNFVELAGDASVAKYLESGAEAKVSYRVIFCTYSECTGTSFEQQLSLSQNSTAHLLETYNISPQFIPRLLAEPDHLAPGYFEDYIEPPNKWKLLLQFFCQHPRWYVQENKPPLSVYMNHDTEKQCTTYLISSAAGSTICRKIKTRLYDQYCTTNLTVDSKDQFTLRIPDPFMLHTMITHESLEDGKPRFTKLRNRLEDLLDVVHSYAALPMHKRDAKSRRVLEHATVHLHDVSQDVDSTIASVDTSQAITDLLIEAQKGYISIKLSNPDSSSPAALGQKTRCALRYLSNRISSQRRWLTSCKSRKNIAMNLVFNLVTQQDAASITRHGTSHADRWVKHESHRSCDDAISPSHFRGNAIWNGCAFGSYLAAIHCCNISAYPCSHGGVVDLDKAREEEKGIRTERRCSLDSWLEICAY